MGITKSFQLVDLMAGAMRGPARDSLQTTEVDWISQKRTGPVSVYESSLMVRLENRTQKQEPGEMGTVPTVPTLEASGTCHLYTVVVKLQILCCHWCDPNDRTYIMYPVPSLGIPGTVCPLQTHSH